MLIMNEKYCLNCNNAVYIKELIKSLDLDDKFVYLCPFCYEKVM